MIWKAIRKIILIIMIDYRFLCEYSFNVLYAQVRTMFLELLIFHEKASSQ